MAERRDLARAPGRVGMVQSRGQPFERTRRGDVRGFLRTADPVLEGGKIHGATSSHRVQNDFGSPSACVATCERIRFVEMGATR